MHGFENTCYVIQYRDEMSNKIYYLADDSSDKGIEVVDNLESARKMSKTIAKFYYENILIKLELGKHFVIKSEESECKNIYCYPEAFFNNSKIIGLNVKYEII